MSKDYALNSEDLEYVADMLKAIRLVRHELGPLPGETLSDLLHALPKAEAVLRACANKMNRNSH